MKITTNYQDCNYFTAGKQYDVIGDIVDDYCYIIDDEGQELGTIVGYPSAHFMGEGHFYIVEE